MNTKALSIVAFAAALALAPYLGGNANGQRQTTRAMPVSNSVAISYNDATVLGTAERIALGIDQQLIDCAEPISAKERSFLSRMVGCAPIN
jgi:hypothetical protein